MGIRPGAKSLAEIERRGFPEEARFSLGPTPLRRRVRSNKVIAKTFVCNTLIKVRVTHYDWECELESKKQYSTRGLPNPTEVKPVRRLELIIRDDIYPLCQRDFVHSKLVLNLKKTLWPRL